MLTEMIGWLYPLTGELARNSFGSKTEGCENATEHTVTEWLSCDTEANQIYTDEEIISLVQNKPQDDSDLEETDESENVLVPHSEAANVPEIALRYMSRVRMRHQQTLCL
ncbi:hypothetical protein AVEN_5706-1 [Araneus ventricosus]|uniref:Uncharacterized protein n=1 Tax=Araneus ventricosus TaxID=182803 RepID=A0A4Y1ZW74_ARAVE|nr:hypothetical protein AVEN_5706-1 [Araneus ventricosus]